MNNYICLKNNTFVRGNYSIVPIRFEDMFEIMKWRNDQLFHLRQSKLLTVSDQKLYFKNVISQLFSQKKPNQILFSYLENGVCIGYGGLVNLNWQDKNAEISFIMNTDLEKLYFNKHWQIFLKLIEKVAFKELQFHKIYTYAFDLRPHLYSTLINAKYLFEARLIEHCLYDDKYIDVLIHSKIVNDKV